MRILGWGLACLVALGIPAQARPLQTIELAPRASLPRLARAALEHYFATGTFLATPDPLPQQRPAGVFVTLSRRGKTRGCWGSLVATAPDLAAATVRAAVGAATRDWRYPPLQPSELADLSIQVAIVRQVTPVASVQEVDPTRAGLFIRSGSRGAVLLPGEALTSEWQLSTARRLAGIPAGDAVELYRVQADLLYEF